MSQVKFTCRYLLLTVLLCAVGAGVYAQFEVLDSFPTTSQLYPRKSTTNTGTVRVKGKLVAGTPYESLRLVITKDSDPAYLSDLYTIPVQTINIPVNSSREFKVEYELLAELQNYQFQLFGIDNNIQSLLPLVEAQKVVSGDIYMIQGQSNASATIKSPFNSSNSANNDPLVQSYRQFIRAFGHSSDVNRPGFTDYNTMVKKWYRGDGNANITDTGNVGQWGIWMASKLLEVERVPVAIINHAVNGKPISYYQPQANRFDVNTTYGRAIQRSKDGGVFENIRAIFWFQGESNWGGEGGLILNSEQYKTELETLVSSWKTDYPGLQKVYIFQTRYGCWDLESDAAEIADGIRKVAANPSFPYVTLISTNGIPQANEGGDLGNCHYYFQSGYKKIGERAFYLISRDFYGRTYPAGTIDAPIPVKFYFSIENNGVASELIIDLNSSADFFIQQEDMLDTLFVLNGGNYTINDIEVDNGPVGNNAIPTRIKLKFTRNSGTLTNPTSVTFRSYKGGYSDPATPDDQLLPVPVVPAIVNANGIGLVSFNNLPENFSILPVDPLSLFVRRTGNTNNVKWEVEENSDFVRFAVERSTNGTNFSMLSELFGKATSGKEVYNYADVNITGQVFYRIKATRKTGGVVYSQVVRINDNGSLRPGLTISPNPVINQAFINVTVAEKTSASIQLFNLQGARVSQRNVELLKGSNNFSLGEMLDQLPGVYMVKVVTPQEVFTSRLIKLR